ncbi:MAG: cobalamin biosynthesis protein CobQ, partial [Oscillospiraceae bacterium]|nr:cobalamin biosynthesis protein CobQ [Oscillospiraceae bacterium]
MTYIITGHYGSGKTNIAVNLAIEKSKETEVTVVDLDIVNYYFRTADFKELFSKHNIKFQGISYANSNLDIPSINFELTENAKNTTVIDVGGDDEGAKVLGMFDFKQYEMYYVFNMYRYMTKTP